MPITPITAFRFTYRPFDRDFPIQEVQIFIKAKNRKEAELIALENNWRFFDKDCTCEVTELLHGFKNE